MYCDFCEHFSRDEVGLYCCRFDDFERKAFDVGNLMKRCPLENENGEIKNG